MLRQQQNETITQTGAAMGWIDQLQSGFASDQFPGYLLPDGSWRYGVHAKKIAEAAWACRRSRTLQEDRDARSGDADRRDVAQ